MASDDDRVTTIMDGKHISFVRRGSWEYVTRRRVSGIVGIVALTVDRKMLLVEQYRPPLAANVIELPAGLAGDGKYRGESMESAARRELLEETGYEATSFEYVGGGAASAGITDELISMFVATGLNKVGEAAGDGGEQITLHQVPLDQIESWLAGKAQTGVLIDLKVYGGLYFAGVKRKK